MPASGLYPVRIVALLSAAAIVLCAVDSRASTPAGSTITNIATSNYTIGTTTSGGSSNSASLRIEELLDIDLQTSATSPVLTVGTVAGIPYSLRNAGNGNESFVLQGQIDSATFLGFAIDSNGNGVFDSADTLVANGAATQMLASGQTLPLFALVRADAAGGGTLRVSAQAATGSGKPGTLYPGKGDGGSDAIVGLTTAAATIPLPFSATTTGGGGGSTPDATLVKSASVLAPDGSNSPVSGAIVTYTIAASFVGPDPARAATITDPVPDGTDYVPASLRLDGVALSDAVDADAGTVAGNAIAVSLGDVAGAATHTLSFQVKLK